MLCFEDRQNCLKNLICCPTVDDPAPDPERPEIEIVDDVAELQE